MSLYKEIKGCIFCSALRPKVCLKEINLCCVLCDKIEECIIKNKEEKSKIMPCEDTIENLNEEGCVFLI